MGRDWDPDPNPWLYDKSGNRRDSGQRRRTSLRGDDSPAAPRTAEQAAADKAFSEGVATRVADRQSLDARQRDLRSAHGGRHVTWRGAEYRVWDFFVSEIPENSVVYLLPRDFPPRPVDRRRVGMWLSNVRGAQISAPLKDIEPQLNV